jgi:TonB-linked SusC/RagA family outer membrane protein
MRKIYVVLFAFILLLSGTGIFAQNIPIKGRVTGSDGASLPGVVIQVKGTNTGTTSDMNGDFSISAAGSDVLVISYIGYESQEIAVNSQASFNITLQEEQKQIEEVVITALGVEKKESTIGYAVHEVKGDAIVKARDPNPITGLTGKVAGLSVGQSAEMLRKPNVLLRGDQLTLYVVDGVPISSDTWNISPDDIESYTVLKGPAAAALYGSRAQNGAILINTKKEVKGRKGVVVEINSSNMFDKGFLAFPRVQNEYGGGENELYAFGDGKGGGLNDNDYDVWGPKFRGQLIPQFDGEYDPNTTYTTTFAGGTVFSGHIKPTPYVARGVNNLENFLRTGFQTTNNISISRTEDDYSIRLSLSHSYQQSIIPNMELNITNFNMYGSYKVNRRLSVEGNINFNYQYTPNYPDVDYGPNSMIYNISIWTGADWDVNDPKVKGIWQDGKVGIQPIFAEYQRYHNPWAMVNYWLRSHHKKDIYGYVSAHYNLDEHLNLSLRTQVSTYDLLRTEQMPVWAHPYSREQNLGDYREDRRALIDNNTDLQLNYSYIIGNFLQLSGLVGGNVRLFSYSSDFTSTDYLNVPGVYAFSNSRNPIQSNNFMADMRVFSGYGSLDADFGKYATVSVTGRVDKSSAISSSHDTYFYPGVSLASLVSDYVKMPKIISSLKIRGSFAAVRGVPTSETIGTSPFNTITALGANPSNSIYGYPLDYGNNYLSPYGGPTYELNPSYSQGKPYNNQPAAYYTDNLSDPDIKPFNRVSYEEGFNVRLIKNRIGLGFTAFQYIDGPQILLNEISSSSGYTGYYINALKTKKTGYEVTLSGTPVSSVNGITWDVMINWSTFKDVYLELPSGQQTYKDFYSKGDRVDKLYASAFYKTHDGQVIHDNAGKPLANQVPQFLGNLNGDYQWSIYNKVGYRNLFLGFQFDGNVGGVTVDYMHNKTMRGGRNIETVEGALGIARNADDEHAGDPNFTGTYVGEGVTLGDGQSIEYDSKTGAITNYDELQFFPNTTPTHVQDYVSKYYGVDESNLMSKTYAKLREITLGYNLPSKWLARTAMTKVSVSFVARNVLYLYGDKRFKDVDLDQYNGPTSLTQLQSPTTRRYGFNINVVF